MGLDLELFVYPDRISSQLICPICTVILENPIQTDNEHLFCEEELLEWLTRSNLCPVSHTELDPSTIRKPPRIITNMLNELEVFCRNRAEGCLWQGEYCKLTSHMKTCNMKSKDQLIAELNRKEQTIASLKRDLSSSLKRITELEDLNKDLELEAKSYQRKLKVYDAFFQDNIDNGGKETSLAEEESALQKVSRLRRLETFQSNYK